MRGWGRGESKFPSLSLSLFSTLLFSCSLHSGHTLPSEHLEQATLSGSLRTYTFHQVHVQLSIPILFQPKKHLRTLMPRHLHGVDKSCTQSVINEEQFNSLVRIARFHIYPIQLCVIFLRDYLTQEAHSQIKEHTTVIRKILNTIQPIKNFRIYQEMYGLQIQTYKIISIYFLE